MLPGELVGLKQWPALYVAASVSWPAGATVQVPHEYSLAFCAPQYPWAVLERAGGRKAYADSGGRVGAGLVQGHCSQLQALGCAFGGVCQAGAFNRLCKAHTHAGVHACVTQDASVKEHWPNIVSLIIEHAAPLHKQVAPIIESDARCAAAAHTRTELPCANARKAPQRAHTHDVASRRMGHDCMEDGPSIHGQNAAHHTNRCRTGRMSSVPTGRTVVRCASRVARMCCALRGCVARCVARCAYVLRAASFAGPTRATSSRKSKGDTTSSCSYATCGPNQPACAESRAEQSRAEQTRTICRLTA